MPFSDDEKKSMLLENFDLLKDNYKKNCNSFSKIIGQMSKLDKSVAVDMWLYLLSHNRDILHDTNVLIFTDACYITEYVTTVISEYLGQSETVKLIIENEQLMNYLFSESSCISFCVASTTYGCINILSTAISMKNLYVANSIYSLLENNKYNCLTTKKQIIYNVISDLKYLEFDKDEAFNLILSWIERLDDPEDRASLKVDLLDLVEAK